MTTTAKALNRMAWMVALTAATLISAPAMAQSPTPAQTPSSDSNVKEIQLVAATAELSKTLDTKKAKQGDPVMLKLSDAVKTSGGPELPKGTLLMGHLDTVQPSESKSDSSVTITLDKAQLKGGQDLPIKATIIKVIPFYNSMQQSQGGGGADQVPSSGSAPGSASGTTPGGGMNRPAGVPAPNIGASTGANNAAPQPGVSDQMSAAPGVNLHSDIHEKTSATFTSKGKNVHIIGGTQFQVALAPVSTQ